MTHPAATLAKYTDDWFSSGRGSQNLALAIYNGATYIAMLVPGAKATCEQWKKVFGLLSAGLDFPNLCSQTGSLAHYTISYMTTGKDVEGKLVLKQKVAKETIGLVESSLYAIKFLQGSLLMRALPGVSLGANIATLAARSWDLYDIKSGHVTPDTCFKVLKTAKTTASLALAVVSVLGIAFASHPVWVAHASLVGLAGLTLSTVWVVTDALSFFREQQIKTTKAA